MQSIIGAEPAGEGSVPNPLEAIASSPMTARQIIAITICVLLNALDGFDVLAISFAAPGIAKEWGIDRAALGFVLSMELFGMAIGSILLGQVADRIGRRGTVLVCLCIMSIGMLATTQAGSIIELTALRLVTGFGIGGMLATTNAMVGEYANRKWQSAVTAIMAAGYPMGAILGGSIASALLQSNSWHIVFWVGAAMALPFIPLVWLLLPEPVSFLLQRRTSDTIDAVNQSLHKLGHKRISQLPQEHAFSPKSSFSALLTGPLRRVTLVLTGAYFLHIMTFYFVLKWVPKIVADLGFPASAAGSVLVWANVGGLIGSLLFSFLTLRAPLRSLLLAAMLASALMVTVFGWWGTNLANLTIAAATAGFFTNAAVVGLYALVAASYPSAARAGGSGFVIGFGRGGAALGPILGGVLMQAGLGLGLVATAMACGSLAAALVLLKLRIGKMPPSF